MDEWFERIATNRCLRSVDAQALRENGFIVIPGPVSSDGIGQLSRAYDHAVATAASEDIAVGRSSTRVSNLIDRLPILDSLLVFEPLLDGCYQIIGRPFKLSSLHARTLRSRSGLSDLHVDSAPDNMSAPLLGFILMVDEFRPSNGATRFVPGSQRWTTLPKGLTDHPDQVYATGNAGSLIIFNGSVWHGPGTNLSDSPRRSIQGAFIQRDALAATMFSSQLSSSTLSRLEPLARYLLNSSYPT